ncbi:MAG: hypothetical protein Q4F27_01220, partial [Desulfovibrionaceae bacterium]|nr:hypothetical protein [Desulfovibrionaceae bacterium]
AAIDKLRSSAENISSIVSGTTYNGISLLDGDAWASDERLKVNSGSNSASLTIQLGYRERTFFLQNMSDLKQLATDIPTDWTNSTQVDNFKRTLEDSLASAKAMKDRYTHVAESYKSESQYMLNQADIFDDVAENSLSGIADPLLGGRGSIFSSSA